MLIFLAPYFIFSFPSGTVPSRRRRPINEPASPLVALIQRSLRYPRMMGADTNTMYTIFVIHPNSLWASSDECHQRLEEPRLKMSKMSCRRYIRPSQVSDNQRMGGSQDRSAFEIRQGRIEDNRSMKGSVTSPRLTMQRGINPIINACSVHVSWRSLLYTSS